MHVFAEIRAGAFHVPLTLIFTDDLRKSCSAFFPASPPQYLIDLNSPCPIAAS